MSSLLIENLNFSFGQHKILENLNLNIQNKEIHVFLGKSGIGKTTLLKLICGLEHAQSGRISKDGKILTIKTSSFHQIKEILELYFKKIVYFIT